MFRVVFFLIPFLLFQIMITEFSTNIPKIKYPSLAFARNLLFFTLILSTIFARMKLESLYWLGYFIQSVIWFYYLKQIIESEQIIKLSIVILNITALIVYFVGLQEVLNGARATSVLESANSFVGYSYFFILVNLFLLKLKIASPLKIMSILTIFLSIIMIITTQSRGGQIGVLISLVVYLIMHNWGRIRKLLFALILFFALLFVLVVVFGPSTLERYTEISSSNIDISTIDRVGLWMAAIELFKQSPIVGIGLNNYYDFYPPYHPFFGIFHLKAMRVAHNLYLNTLAENGIIGFTVLILIIIILFRFLIKQFKNPLITENGKDLVIIVMAYFVYFLIHNLFDCIFTSLNHQLIPFQAVFMLVLLINLEKYYLVNKPSTNSKIFLMDK